MFEIKETPDCTKGETDLRFGQIPRIFYFLQWCKLIMFYITHYSQSFILCWSSWTQSIIRAYVAWCSLLFILFAENLLENVILLKTSIKTTFFIVNHWLISNGWIKTLLCQNLIHFVIRLCIVETLFVCLLILLFFKMLLPEEEWNRLGLRDSFILRKHCHFLVFLSQRFELQVTFLMRYRRSW